MTRPGRAEPPGLTDALISCLNCSNCSAVIVAPESRVIPPSGTAKPSGSFSSRSNWGHSAARAVGSLRPAKVNGLTTDETPGRAEICCPYMNRAAARVTSIDSSPSQVSKTETGERASRSNSRSSMSRPWRDSAVAGRVVADVI